MTIGNNLIDVKTNMLIKLAVSWRRICFLEFQRQLPLKLSRKYIFDVKISLLLKLCFLTENIWSWQFWRQLPLKLSKKIYSLSRNWAYYHLHCCYGVGLLVRTVQQLCFSTVEKSWSSLLWGLLNASHCFDTFCMWKTMLNGHKCGSVPENGSLRHP